LRNLAKLILDENDYSNFPHKLAKSTVILPNHRASIALKKELIDLSSNKALILPNIVSLGDFDEEDLSFELIKSNRQSLEILPAIPKVKRLILITKLIQDISQKVSYLDYLSFSQAFKISSSLTDLIDDSYRYEKPFENVENILPEDLALDKQESLSFLKTFFEQYPKQLKSLGYIDAIERRNIILAEYRKILAGKQNKQQVFDEKIFIAGSTGSLPETRRLIKTISELDNGYVILPYIDRQIDESIWQNISPIESEINHQSLVKNLLDHLAIARNNIKILGGYNKAQDKEKIISNIFSPTDYINLWKDEVDYENFQNSTSLIEVDNQIDEANLVSLAARQALEQNKKTAIVTNDRNLARNIKEFLEYYEVKIDDSAGESLLNKNIGKFIYAVSLLISNPDSVVNLINLLKNKYCDFSLNRNYVLSKLLDFEKDFVRKNNIISNKILYKNLSDKSDKNSLEQFEQKILGLLELILISNESGSYQSIANLVQQHWQIINILANNFEEKLDSDIAKKLIDLFNNLSNLESGYKIAKSEYSDLFRYISSTITIRGKFGFTPKISILSPIEARLEKYDLVILSGLNNNSWPSLPNSPWLNRNMKKEFGLPLEEMFIALSAHDFTSLLHHEQVVLTRSKNIGGSVTSESPFLTRLKAYCEYRNIDLCDKESCQKLLSYLKIFKGSTIKQIPYEQQKTIPPEVPISKRPNKISLTDIDKIVLNPYQYFVAYILNLRKLNDLGIFNESSEYGNYLHKIMKNFADIHNGDVHKITPENLSKTIQDQTDKAKERSLFNDIWLPKVNQLIPDIINSEKLLSKDVLRIFAEEPTLAEIKLPSGNKFYIKTRADRIELLKNGNIRVIDIKTGSHPKDNEVRKLVKPQLPLTANFVLNGDFENIKISSGSNCDAMIYYSIISGSKNINLNEITEASGGDFKNITLTRIAEKSRELLIELCEDLLSENVKFLAFPSEDSKKQFNDYYHLARVEKLN
jgi:ATP-dependent helicase/nuclease subunit B